MIKCGGCCSVNSNKTSSFCDGYILSTDDNDNDNNEYIKVFKLPNLEISWSRRNHPSIYDLIRFRNNNIWWNKDK